MSENIKTMTRRSSPSRQRLRSWTAACDEVDRLEADIATLKQQLAAAEGQKSGAPSGKSTPAQGEKISPYDRFCRAVHVIGSRNRVESDPAPEPQEPEQAAEKEQEQEDAAPGQDEPVSGQDRFRRARRISRR